MPQLDTFFRGPFPSCKWDMSFPSIPDKSPQFQGNKPGKKKQIHLLQFSWMRSSTEDVDKLYNSIKTIKAGPTVLAHYLQGWNQLVNAVFLKHPYNHSKKKQDSSQPSEKKFNFCPPQKNDAFPVLLHCASPFLWSLWETPCSTERIEIQVLGSWLMAGVK